MIGADTTFLVHLEIREAPAHAEAHRILQDRILKSNVPLVLTSQVLAEFVHIVTDSRRFQNPLSMEGAIEKAMFWWNAREVRHAHPTAESTMLFLDWMRKHSLGRKRILDTQLAAVLLTAGVRQIVTANARDFGIFGAFDIIET